MHLIYFFILLVGCSVGGGDKVVEYSSFKENTENIAILSLANCLNKFNREKSIEESDNNSQQNEIPLDVIWVSIFTGVNEVLTINRRYVLKKDAEFCYSSIMFTPCGSELKDFLFSMTYNYMNYCNLRDACFLNNSNFGQGNLCFQ